MTPPTAPAPLVVAASLAAVEGLVLALVGVAELFATTGGRLTMGLTTGVFFLAAGAGLVACGWGLAHARSWGRGPVLLAQVMALVGAWSVREPFTLVAVLLAVAALVTVAGLLHPASMAALDGREASDSHEA